MVISMSSQFWSSDTTRRTLQNDTT